MSLRNARFSTLLIVAILPVVILASGFVLYVAHHARQHLRSELGSKATHATQLLDQAIGSDLAVLQALATSSSLDTGDIAAFREQAKRIQVEKPLWHNVILTTPSQENILSLLRGPETAPLPVVDKASIDAVLSTRQPVVGGISAPGSFLDLRLIPIRVPVIRNGELLYVLTAVLYPRGIAELFHKVVPSDWLGNVVDRSGRVVSRTQEEAKYIGALASTGALKALASGATSGIYKTQALSGENVTVIYRTSRVSGWTIHFAVPDAAFDPGFGRSVLLALTGALLSIALGAVLIWFLYQDIALQRRNDEALRHAQKMEALGQLTGGIVHDFSNVLQVMNGSIEFTLLTAHDESVQKPLALAMIAGERGKSILQRLKGLIRYEATDTQPVFLADHLANTKELLGQLIGEKISTIVEVPSGTWPVEIDAQELDVALMNAATNARDAMPNGGTFKISAANVTLSNDRNDLAPHLRGDFVRLSLRDTGEGMSAETKRQAFEPFFTTKPKDKGTGLGLSQIYGFAVQSGGVAAIESREGVGTTIHLFFPRTFASVTQPVERPRDAATSGKLSKHILVVDDEELVAQTAASVLGTLGYQATTVHSSQDALELLDQGTVFDMVLSDVVMPGGMDGLQLSSELHRRCPELPVLLATGCYASFNVAPHGIRRRMIRKPYNAKHLGEAVEDLMKDKGLAFS